MTIPEAVQLVLQAGALTKGGEVFVLDMGQPVRIVDMACDLIELSGLRPHVDIKIRFTGLRPGEKLFEELLTAEEGTSTSKHKKIFVANLKETDEEILQHGLLALQYIDEEVKIIEVLESLVLTYKTTREQCCISSRDEIDKVKNQGNECKSVLDDKYGSAVSFS